MNKNNFLCLALLINMALSGMATAHCQVPCGIYGDQMRFEMLREHITTVEKSMNEITALSVDPGKNMNQLVRWVNNKEQHSDEFSEILTQYFLAQRIKPDTEQYHLKLELLHKMQVSAMKCKQTTDLKNVTEMKSLVDQFEQVYMPKSTHDHDHSHEG